MLLGSCSFVEILTTIAAQNLRQKEIIYERDDSKEILSWGSRGRSGC